MHDFSRIDTARVLVRFLVSVMLVVVAGSAASATALDTALRQVIKRHGLAGEPGRGQSLPDVADPVAQLGRDLFFSKALSGDRDVACASCHHPLLGGGDGLSLSVGIGAREPDHVGPGRAHDWQGRGSADPKADGGPNVARNASTTFNVAFYQRVLFHDGRIEMLPSHGSGETAPSIRTPDSLFGAADARAGKDLVSAQARFPVTSLVEMRGFDFLPGYRNEMVRARIQARLGNYGPGTGELESNHWLERFRIAFDDPDAPPEELITYQNIAEAMSRYQRSQIFVDSPWNAYVKGDDGELDPEAKRGALLFFNGRAEGGAGCVGCHTGDLFSDEQFHVLAMPQIGRGKDKGANDFGRYRTTRLEEDRFAFRTPSLLNVSVTAPYGHAGAYSSLEAVVAHHLDPETAVHNFDFTLRHLPQFRDMRIGYPRSRPNTESALQKLRSQQAAGLFVIEKVLLANEDIRNIVKFLDALTDPCVTSAECLSAWIPERGVEGPDALRLEASIGP